MSKQANIKSKVMQYLGDVSGKNVAKAKEILKKTPKLKDPFLDEVLTAPGQSPKDLLSKAIKRRDVARKGTAIGAGGLAVGSVLNGRSD